ncbi:MAG: bifunctional nuclease family protein [Sphingobacteriaceae bacterium]|nr:bifunctional nuclease family protein [Sphingobacteriaceae bacterium]
MKKIELEIIALSDGNSSTNSYAVVLGEKGGNRRLPVIIGAFEAQAIAIELEKMKPARPLTHDLFKNFADAFQLRLEEVVISDLKEGIFYSRLHCRNGSEYHDIDARTSDALALAVRFNCPIFTYEPILDTGGIVFDAEQEAQEDIKAETMANEPKRKGGFDDKSDAELKKLMEEALLNENYEKAAMLRDELERRNSL